MLVKYFDFNVVTALSSTEESTRIFSEILLIAITSFEFSMFQSINRTVQNSVVSLMLWVGNV